MGGNCNYDNPPDYESTYSTLNTVNGCSYMNEAVRGSGTSLTDRYEISDWEQPYTEDSPLYVNGFGFFVDTDNNIAFYDTYGLKTIIGRFDGYRYFEVIETDMVDENTMETITGVLLSLYSAWYSEDLIITKTKTLLDGIIDRDLPTCGSGYNARYFFIATPEAGGSGGGLSGAELDSRNIVEPQGHFTSRAISNMYTMKILNAPSVDVTRTNFRGIFPRMLR
jgi:hypothetical protein